MSNCELCGEPMPEGETMFMVHGYSGPCPKPPLPKEQPDVEGAFSRAFDRADKLEQYLQEAQEQIHGLNRSIWLILRAVSIGRPLVIPRTDVDDFNPSTAMLESWTEPNGDHCFRAAITVRCPQETGHK